MNPGVNPGMAPDGTWPDIDYTARDPHDFPQLEHLARVPALPPRDRLTALDAWRRLAPRSENWWYNEVGAPEMVGDALLGVADLLDDERRRAWGDWLRDAAGPVEMTGQNLVWAAAVQLRRGLLTGDDAVVRHEVARMCSVLEPTTGEGVQPDLSFHQHGPQLYSGGYGASLVASLTRWVHLFDAPARRAFADFLLDGQQWFAHGDTYDFTCMGREVVRPDSHRVDSLRDAVTALARHGHRADELAACAARLSGGGEPLVGTRWFPRSDYLAHRRPGWSCTVRASSTRTVPTESLNGENTSGRHLGDGVTAFRVTGAPDGYRDAIPRWDWARLPGTTTEQGRSLFPRPYLERGASDDVRGWADGAHGVATMRLAGTDRFADGWKTWFCFPDAVVALGAGITAPAAGRVLTTVDQRVAAGPVAAGAGRVAHAGLVYRSLGGEWSAEVRDGLLAVWFDHGEAPRDATYSYVVAPADVEVEVLVNTPEAQAVRCGGATLTRAHAD
ncbi:polysaccharide lyase family 8 super-sandwich domain-containing protein [Saccharothrix syringae]|uniref:Silent information regulator protein Sir2 n=1 Tax=Saccharothrix syringae TaxID=103733 RepID=A0A5Q0GS63_SACSY|nr:polysaccharide lyase family 8 super-sandwich domain-containing protein [Saccharothrix syringae]QFZ16515.1 silent information regulator protein Sir2 [Saccharothrix syringae]